MNSKPVLFVGILIIFIAIIGAIVYVFNDNKSAISTNNANTPIYTNIGSNSIDITATTIELSNKLDIPYPASTTIDTASWPIYIDKSRRYTIEYPSNMIMSANEDVFTVVFPKSLYFRWPLEDSVKISVVVSVDCPTTIGGVKNNRITENTFELNGYIYKRRYGVDVAAGNIYTELAYDTVVNGNCYHISYYNQGANGAGLYVNVSSLVTKYDAQHEIDMAKSLDIFNAMVKSFRILAN